MADDSKNKSTINKILVAVDHTSHSGRALESAVMFAKITEANIHGVYVREEYWGRLHPASTFINEFTGRTKHFEESRLEQHVEAIERRLERKLKMISHRYEIGHSWQSLRGRVIEEILKAGKDADLITIGRRSRSSLNQKKLGSTAKAIIERSEKPILVLAETQLTGRAVIAVYDESKESHKGLRLALSIAQKNKSRVLIISLFKNKDEESESKELQKIVERSKVPINVATLTRRTIGNFIHMARQQNPGLVVIPKEHALLNDGSIEDLLHYTKCAVLFMS